jgi:hypothetical protein
MHQEEIDFHQVIFVDHQQQLLVEYDEERVVIHHTELLNIELGKLSPK